MRSIKVFTGSALTLALFIIMAAVVYAASGAVNEIQGTIKDALGRPLAGAGLVLKSPDETVKGKTKSDANGHFVFSNVMPGTYAVLAEKSGFQTGTAIVTVEAGTIATATLTLAATGSTGGGGRGGALEPGSKQPVTKDGRQYLQFRPE